MSDRKLNTISKEERFKFNVIDAADDYRGSLRNCDQVYHEYRGQGIRQ